MNVIDDLEAEEARIEAILTSLGDAAWEQPSAAAGWSMADVVLHLAQSEELVVAAVEVAPSVEPKSLADALSERSMGQPVDQMMEERVKAERAGGRSVLARWHEARLRALAGLRQADGHRRIPWVTNALSPSTLATTRLAEHWAHMLDIVEPLRIPYEDTARLRHIAWLGHRTLPYAFALGGIPAIEVRCELTGPDGDTWEFGPAEATTRITGPAGDFCRVGARRLPAKESRLVASGPHADVAVGLLRNYAQ